MDKHVVAVFLSLGLYVLYVMLPLIPAVWIYRWFPDTKVGVRGPLGTLTVSATGAFAAYVTTVGLGFFVVENTQQLISSIPHTTWTIKGQVELRDSNGDPVQSPALLEALEVTILPDVTTKAGQHVQVKIPGGGTDTWPHPNLQFYIPEFGTSTVNLETAIEEGAAPDRYNNTLALKDPIVIIRLENPYNP